MCCVGQFDGDGMIHAVRIKGGKAAYSNHWVLTERLRQEQNAGRALFLKVSASQMTTLVCAYMNRTTLPVILKGWFFHGAS
jgi:carotenoid cleavage dioxygenase-like enzyme